MKKLTTHPRKLVFFTTLSLADLVLTCYLVRRSHGWVYEANPLASWWLDAWGWMGLASFKIMAVLVVTSLAAVISVHRPALGGKVLAFACAAVAGVLVYSCALVGQAQAGNPYEQAMAQAQQLERQMQKNQRYLVRLERLVQDLIAERRSLAEALAELAQTERSQDPEFLKCLHVRHPNCPNNCLLAIDLIETTVICLELEPARAREIARRLWGEYRAMFGSKGLAQAQAEETEDRADWASAGQNAERNQSGSET